MTAVATTQEQINTGTMSLTLTSVNPSFTVSDLQKSLAWYRDVLGFTVGERWEHEGKLAGIELKAGQVSVYLSQDDWKKGRDRVKGEGFSIHYETDQDIDKLAAHIKAKGGRLLQDPASGWGSRHFAIADPDGFKIMIEKPD